MVVVLYRWGGDRGGVRGGVRGGDWGRVRGGVGYNQTVCVLAKPGISEMLKSLHSLGSPRPPSEEERVVGVVTSV